MQACGTECLHTCLLKDKTDGKEQRGPSLVPAHPDSRDFKEPVLCPLRLRAVDPQMAPVCLWEGWLVEVARTAHVRDLEAAMLVASPRHHVALCTVAYPPLGLA